MPNPGRDFKTYVEASLARIEAGMLRMGDEADRHWEALAEEGKKNVQRVSTVEEKAHNLEGWVGNMDDRMDRHEALDLNAKLTAGQTAAIYISAALGAIATFIGLLAMKVI